jgi:hypothetical protein
MERREHRMGNASLAPDVRFRYPMPGGPGEVVGAADVVAKPSSGSGEADILEVPTILVDLLTERISARYRFLLHQQEGGRWSSSRAT